MTGWIIFGSILLVLILILIQSVTVTAIYDKTFELTVKILFFTIVKSPADPKKKKKKKKKPEKRKASKAAKDEPKRTDNTDNTDRTGDTDNGGVGTLNDYINGGAEDTDNKDAARSSGGKPDKPDEKSGEEEKKSGGMPDFGMIKDYVESAWPPVKRLFKKIRYRDIYLDWVVGSDDAAKTALKYGGICSAVYSLLEWLKTYFSVKVGEINIEADFGAEKDDIFFFGRVKLRISTALACIIWLGVRMLKTYLKYNKKTEKKTENKKPAWARR